MIKKKKIFEFIYFLVYIGPIEVSEGLVMPKIDAFIPI